MLTSVLESGVGVGPYPELSDKRILITNMSLQAGVDVARAFAENGCRIVLHTRETGVEIDAVLEMLAQSAAELQVYSDPLADTEATTKFAQTAAKAFNGLDSVINLLHLDLEALTSGESRPAEEALAWKIQTAQLISRIAANRMRLTWSEGLILNILVSKAPQTPKEATILSLARTMLAGMTRSEAQKWADQAIRINAVAPAVDAGICSGAEPKVAALAMFLATPDGREFSGLMFDVALAGDMPETV